MARIKDLDNKVRAMLYADERSRNSDIRLTHMIWARYYASLLTQANGKVCVPLVNMYELPREDNIKRIRAKIQNEEKLYLPTTWEVAKKRGMQEDEWRSYLGKSIAGIDNQHL